uniref:DRY_EERY domain-containing protein n=1 Tax=Panagrellus redivivus TaxID=6233 RepID=A0A7E4VII7_PANRE
MWHEARRMEKAVYQAINTTAKRKEQARRAHDIANASKDPSELLCIYGNSLTIHTDANIAQAADESNTMTKWQGDDSLIIDRFDARNLLDAIPKKPATSSVEEPSNVDEYVTQLQLDYERFKELIAVAFTGESEADVLRSIADRDAKVALAKATKNERKHFKNKKPPNKKAAIDFNYDNDDGETTSNGNHGNSSNKPANRGFVKPSDGSDSSDDEDNDDDELFSAKMSSIVFSTQDWERIDEIAEKFHLPRDAFSKLYEVDRAFLSVLFGFGRASRRDRARLKRRKQLILKDPLNEDAVSVLRRFAVRRLREITAEEGSSSNSDDDEVEEKTEFITCFGDNSASGPGSNKRKSPPRPAPTALLNTSTPTFRKSRIKRESRSASPFGDAWGTLKPTPKTDESSQESTVAFRKQDNDKSPSKQPTSSGWLSSRMKNLRNKRSPSPISPPSSEAGNSADDVPLEIRSSMSESEQERIEIENRKRRLRKTKRELKRRKKPSPEDHNSEEDESRKRINAAKKLREHLQANLSKTHKEMLDDERDKKAQVEVEMKSRNAGEYVQRRPSRSLSPPHRTEKSRSPSPHRNLRRERSRSRSPRRYRSRSRSHSPVRDRSRYRRSHRDRRSRSRSSEHRHYKRWRRSRSPRERR